MFKEKLNRKQIATNRVDVFNVKRISLFGANQNVLSLEYTPTNNLYL